MLITKAREGDSAAQYEIACILASGQLGAINHQASFHWFMKAALKGHVDAMWNAGLQLVLGVGVEEAIDAGLYLIDLAASRYCYSAIRYLADTYHLGLHGVPVDSEKSDYLYRLAESLEAWQPKPISPLEPAANGRHSFAPMRDGGLKSSLPRRRSTGCNPNISPDRLRAIIID